MGRRGAIAPDVGLWQINRWLPLIVLFVIAALPLIALGQTSRPDSDPWRARVVSTIEEIENDTITLKAIHTKLEKAGMPTEAASDQAYLEWLSRQSEDVSHNLVLLTNIQNKIDQHLVELWFQSHNPGPIPGIEIQLLIGEAPFVTDYYRKWLGQFSGTEADAMKAAIPANINAIDTPYGLQAILELQHCAAFEAPLVVDHPSQLWELTQNCRWQARTVFENWYRANAPTMIWNPKLDLYTLPDGSFYAIPDLDISFQ